MNTQPNNEAETEAETEGAVAIDRPVMQHIEGMIASAYRRESICREEPDLSEIQAAYWNGVAYGLEQLSLYLDGKDFDFGVEQRIETMNTTETPLTES